MTKSYHINELAISLILLATVKSLNCLLYFLVCKWKFYYSSTKYHKLKRRVELKESKIILKNYFGQFNKLNNDNS